MTLKTIAIIPAAGAGTRMGAGRSKQFLALNGRPMLAVTLAVFQECPGIDGVILVAPAADLPYCREQIVGAFDLSKVLQVVAGGERRQDSVRLGIAALPDDCERVLIHDGVRPLIHAAFIEEVLRAAQTYPAVITALPAKETVKQVDDRETVVSTLERGRLRLVQTPQVFRAADIRLAHQRAVQEGWPEATDDAQLIERLGIPIKVVQGLEHNVKITTPHDLAMAEFLLQKRPA